MKNTTTHKPLKVLKATHGITYFWTSSIQIQLLSLQQIHTSCRWIEEHQKHGTNIDAITEPIPLLRGEQPQGPKQSSNPFKKKESDKHTGMVSLWWLDTKNSF